MALRLQMMIIGMALASCLYIFWQVKRKKLDLRYVFSWMVLCASIVFLTLHPELLKMLARLTGIASPVNMLFFFGLCLGMSMIFTLSVAVSHLNEHVKRLAQELAILREQVYESCTTREDQDERT